MEESAMKERIELIQGDITTMEVDAIVNAANTNLLLGGGLAGAIRTKGGASIQEECAKQAPVPLGGAAVTGAGKLPATAIIHAASMALGGKTTPRALVDATLNSLRAADKHSFKTIAFPAIGSGIGGFPVDQCAHIMLQEIKTYLAGDSKIDKVYLVLFDDETFKVFKKNYDTLFGE